MRSKKPVISIVIPFYNEEENVNSTLSNVVNALSKINVPYEIVAVNNGSKDNTATLLSQITKENSNIKICTVEKNIGYGWGIISGLNMSKGKYVGYMWGDGQVDAGCLLEIYKKLEEGSPLAKALRISRSGYGMQRRLASLAYNNLFYLLFNVKSADINGCPKIMHRDIYEKIKPVSKDWFIDAEIMIKLKKLGYQFSEVTVIFKKRKGGKSKVRLKTVFEFIKNMVRARLGGFNAAKKREHEGSNLMWWYGHSPKRRDRV